MFLAVDVKAVKPFPKPVTLAAIKAEPRLKEMALAKYPRLPLDWGGEVAEFAGTFGE